jgi:hypothetical protein
MTEQVVDSNKDPIRFMVFKHTNTTWIRHESKEDSHKPCNSRIQLLYYEWKGDYNNPTDFRFCLDCNAVGIRDPNDTIMSKKDEERGWMPQTLYESHRGGNYKYI